MARRICVGVLVCFVHPACGRLGFDAGATDATRSDGACVPGGGAVFSDDFDDGDAIGWTPASGVWAIASGRYEQTDTSAYRAISVAGPSQGDVIVEARVVVTAPADDLARVVFHYSDRDNFSAAYLSVFYSVVGISHWLGGVRVRSEVPFTVTPGQGYLLRAVVVGDMAEVWVDDAMKHGWTLPTARLGRIGISNDASFASFDDFRLSDPRCP